MWITGLEVWVCAYAEYKYWKTPTFLKITIKGTIHNKYNRLRNFFAVNRYLSIFSLKQGWYGDHLITESQNWKKSYCVLAKLLQICNAFPAESSPSSIWCRFLSVFSAVEQTLVEVAVYFREDCIHQNHIIFVSVVWNHVICSHIVDYAIGEVKSAPTI